MKRKKIMKPPNHKKIDRMSLFMSALWVGISMLVVIIVTVAIVTGGVFDIRGQAKGSAGGKSGSSGTNLTGSRAGSGSGTAGSGSKTGFGSLGAGSGSKSQSGSAGSRSR